MESVSVRIGHGGQINHDVVKRCVDEGLPKFDEDQKALDDMAERACGVPQPDKEKTELPF